MYNVLEFHGGRRAIAAQTTGTFTDVRRLLGRVLRTQRNKGFVVRCFGPYQYVTAAYVTGVAIDPIVFTLEIV